MHLLTVMWAQGMHTLTADLRYPPKVTLPDTRPQAFLSLDSYCVTGVPVEIVVFLYPQEQPVSIHRIGNFVCIQLSSHSVAQGQLACMMIISLTHMTLEVGIPILCKS